MTRARHRSLALAGLAAVLLGIRMFRAKPALNRPGRSHTRPGARTGGSADSMQYSALAQITRANVRALEPAWFYRVAGDPVRLPFNPLIVDSVMYVAGTKGVVVALDAATGKELWTSPAEATERGLTYWESEDRSDRRLILTTSNGLREINARTGGLITTFGSNGSVDMRDGKPAASRRAEQEPGRVFENLVIVGSQCRRRLRIAARRRACLRRRHRSAGLDVPHDPAARRIRIRDVAAGCLDSTPAARTPGARSRSTRKNGLVFFPTGSPTHDLYGADRAGNNLFGNCLLALDARTGKRLWHFQTVHHDLWDYDLAAAPKLLTVRHDGKPVDIVAQAGKTGFLYVFERLTGKPLWPIEERPVPKSEVPGEVSSPTQPIPHEAAAVRAPGVHARGRQSVRERGGAGAAAAGGARRRQRRACSHRRAICATTFSFPARGAAPTGAAPPRIRRPACCSCAASRCRAIASMALDSAERRWRSSIQADRASSRATRSTRSICAACHGPGQMPMRSPAKLGAEAFRTLVRQGRRTDAGVLREDAAGGQRRARSRRTCSRCPIDGRAGRERRAAAPAAESRSAIRDPRSATPARFRPGGTRATGYPAVGAAVDAARRLRPERRHDQVARPRRRTRRASPRKAS